MRNPFSLSELTIRTTASRRPVRAYRSRYSRVPLPVCLYVHIGKPADIFFSQYLVELAFAVASVSFDGFVYYVPAFNATFVSAHDSMNMAFQSLFQDFG